MQVKQAERFFGIALGADCRSTLTISEISIVYDCVFPIPGTAQDISGRVRKAMSIVYNTYQLFGFQLNKKRTNIKSL